MSIGDLNNQIARWESNFSLVREEVNELVFENKKEEMQPVIAKITSLIEQQGELLNLILDCGESPSFQASIDRMMIDGERLESLKNFVNDFIQQANPLQAPRMGNQLIIEQVSDPAIGQQDSAPENYYDAPEIQDGIPEIESERDVFFDADQNVEEAPSSLPVESSVNLSETNPPVLSQVDRQRVSQEVKAYLDSDDGEMAFMLSNISGKDKTTLTEMFSHPRFLDLLHKRTHGNLDGIPDLIFSSIASYANQLGGPYDIPGSPGKMWYGSEMNALDLDALKQNKISLIINMAGVDSETGSANFHDEIKTKTYEIEDAGGTIIPFEEIIGEVLQEAKNGGNVLIRCVEGRNRSGAIMLVVMKALYDCSLADAYKKVADRGRVVKLNKGAYEEQVQDFFG